MENHDQMEVWLRGPIPNIHPLLQPVAHALLQVQEELQELTSIFPDHLLWRKPAGVASVGFHLMHMTGILDRLLTYALNESLNEVQRQYLQQEGIPPQPNCSFADLKYRFDEQLLIFLNSLLTINPDELTQVRFVGRAQIPSTQIGLLFHAAEHAQRHLGQLVVTARILLDPFPENAER
jgi:uncharacterized damage-inducible protein DinB